MDKLQKLQKYSKLFNEMLAHSMKLIECNREKCKKETNKQKKYGDIVMEKISKLSKQEEKTKSFKSFTKKKAITYDSYNKHKDVRTYLENLKKDIKNNIKTVLSHKREFKKFLRTIKILHKEYLKTVDNKNYEKARKRIFKELTTNTRYIELAKCSFDKCLKLHKENFILVKKLADKLCKKENIQKACKISSVINKMALLKLTYKDKMRVSKLIKDGFV
tara:strand:+ start:1986 stop:2642 length:657 start_codon:yes stop_codon:yes gene_type:complete